MCELLRYQPMRRMSGLENGSMESFTIIDDDWARLEHKRGRLKEALLTDWESLEAMERTQPKKPEAVLNQNTNPPITNGQYSRNKRNA